MADEETETETTAKETEATKETAVETTAAETETTTATVAVEDENKEPGGSDPQAVRARKEYRARKAAEARLQAQSQELIRTQERARVLEEQAQRKAEPEKKIFTPVEIQAAVDRGEINQAEATAYIVEAAMDRKIWISSEADPG